MYKLQGVTYINNFQYKIVGANEIRPGQLSPEFFDLVKARCNIDS